MSRFGVFLVGAAMAALAATLVVADEPALPSKAEQAAADRLQKLGATIVRNGDGQVLRVSLHSCDARDDDLAALREFPRLKELQLSGQQLTDKTLEHIGKATRLQTLELKRVACTDAGIAHLASLAELELLTIEKSRMTSASFVPLQKLHKLKYFFCVAEFVVPESEEVAAFRKALPDLKLDLFAPDRTKILERLKGAAKVTVLESGHVASVRFHFVDDVVDWLILARFPEIEQLDVSRLKFSDAELKNLRMFPALKLLDLGTTQVTDAGLLHLKPLRQLRYIDVADTSVTEAGIAALREALPELKAVNISHRSLRRDGVLITGADESKGLSIIFADGEATDDDLAALARLQDLSSIHARFSKVTDAGLKSLTDAKVDLVRLDLTGAEVTDGGLLKLVKQGKRLREVHLAGTKVTGDAIKQILEVRPGVSIVLQLPEDFAAIKALRVAGAFFRYNDEELVEYVGLPRNADDELLRSVAKLKAVAEIWSAEETRITDAGLKRLETVRSLQRIVFLTPHATKPGIAALQASLPKAEIIIGMPAK